MNKFEVISKLWPSGALLNGGVDVNTVNPPGQVFTRTAPPLAPGTGAPNGYRFLFWNTGRRVTNKAQVTWTFNNLSSWTTWTATRWYGIAGTGVGMALVPIASRRRRSRWRTTPRCRARLSTPPTAPSPTAPPANRRTPSELPRTTAWPPRSGARPRSRRSSRSRRRWSSPRTTSPAGSGCSSAVTRPASSTRPTARRSVAPASTAIWPQAPSRSPRAKRSTSWPPIAS